MARAAVRSAPHDFFRGDYHAVVLAHRSSLFSAIRRILRRFLENRYGLHAPEQTTEEFLADLRARDTLDAGRKALLGEFLQHCDLIKFANQTPTNDQIQRTFDTCKRFIVEAGPGEAAASAAAGAP